LRDNKGIEQIAQRTFIGYVCRYARTVLKTHMRIK